MLKTCRTCPIAEASPDLSPTPPSPTPVDFPLILVGSLTVGFSTAGPLAALDMGPTLNLQWSVEQMDVLFAITCQKAELELQATTAKIRHKEKESLTKIAAIKTSNGIALTGSTWTREDNKVLLDEISPIILSLASYYSGLPKAKIV